MKLLFTKGLKKVCEGCADRGGGCLAVSAGGDCVDQLYKMVSGMDAEYWPAVGALALVVTNCAPKYSEVAADTPKPVLKTSVPLVTPVLGSSFKRVAARLSLPPNKATAAEVPPVAALLTTADEVPEPVICVAVKPSKMFHVWVAPKAQALLGLAPSFRSNFTMVLVPIKVLATVAVDCTVPSDTVRTPPLMVLAPTVMFSEQVVAVTCPVMSRVPAVWATAAN